MHPAEALQLGDRILKVYEKHCEGVCRKYKINQSTLDVILFLANNPEYNTARDICKIRKIKSGIVSVIVENLAEKEWLRREKDPTDRRKQRLFLTEKVTDLVREGQEVQQKIFGTIFGGLTEEDREVCHRVYEIVIEGIKRLEEI